MEPLYRMNLTLPTLPANLALDEALLEAREVGDAPDLLRFWQWPADAVVLGANGRIGIDVNEEACRADGVALARRSSGGGTVLLGPGCLLFSLILSFDRHPDLKDVTRSYRWILGRIGEAFGAGVNGISDLTIDAMKFSGNAQHRKSESVLHHGTLLLNFDLTKITRYLRSPEREPEYRAGRPHAAFVRNLGIDAESAMRMLESAWDAREEWSDWPREMVEKMTTEQYATDEWIRRR